MEKRLEDELKRLRLRIESGKAAEGLQRLRHLREDTAYPADEIWQLDELAGGCYSMLCDMEGAAGCYWQASTHDKYLRSQMGHYSSYLFCLHYLSDISAQELKQAHFFYNRLFAAIQPYAHAVADHKRKKLRIGYLSTDFHDHSMAAFIRPLLSRRDASRYEVYCYAVQDASDAVTQEFRNLADGWRDLSNRSFVDAAQCIFDDGVDILFDLSGHTHGGCTLIIAAYKPAPVQISGLGWFNTTGLSAIDYFLTDPFLEDDQEQFCEQLLMLPRTHMVYMPGQPFPLPSYGRRKKGVTFGCFNNFAKITNEMLVLWLAIVRSVPGSRLCLQDTLAMPVRCIALRERAVRIGWHQEELELSCGSSDYLSNLSQIDIGLDPYPYPGGSMTCAALYMGVPVVAMAGIRHGSRLGVSLLSNAGLSELIAENPAAYKKIAVSLATDTERCMNLHRTLRQMMQTSRIMDAGAYMYDMEQAYEEIWRIWLNSQT